MSTLGVTYVHHHALPVDVGNPQREQLRNPQACSVQQREHGAMLDVGAPGDEQLLDLAPTQDVRRTMQVTNVGDALHHFGASE